MEFTTNIVMNLLKPYRGRNYIQKPAAKKYRWAMLLPSDRESMSSDILYVCHMSEALKLNHTPQQYHFACICDRYLSDEDRDDKELLQNIILIEENYDAGWLLNIIQERFLELNEWEAKLKDILAEKGSYQDLIDASEHYLKNALFVLDDAYRLVAYSKNYISTDPINQQLYETGFYDSGALQHFYDSGRFIKYEEASAPLPGEPNNISNFETLVEWCFIDNAPAIQLVEVFYNIPRRGDSAELFEMLYHYINLLCISESNENISLRSGSSRFILSVIRGETTNLQTINNCAVQSGLPVKGNFDLYKIIFRNFSKVLAGRFIQDVSMLLPLSYAVSDNHEIYILNVYKNSDFRSETRNNLNHLDKLLRDHGAVCGVSAAFELFVDLPLACAQADAAAYAGLKLDNRNTYHYSDTFIYNLTEAGRNSSFNLFYNNPYVTLINTLKNYDLKYKTDMFNLLRIYLENESRPTETGRILNMHRNTVTYHIQQIKNLLNIDLDDFLTRQGLILAYLSEDIGEPG